MVDFGDDWLYHTIVLLLQFAHSPNVSEVAVVQSDSPRKPCPVEMANLIRKRQISGQKFPWAVDHCGTSINLESTFIQGWHWHNFSSDENHHHKPMAHVWNISDFFLPTELTSVFNTACSSYCKFIIPQLFTSTIILPKQSLILGINLPFPFLWMVTILVGYGTYHL